jgi:hypothetical protein
MRCRVVVENQGWAVWCLLINTSQHMKHYDISKMNCSYGEPPGVYKRRRSVKLETSISGENLTLGGHSG